MTAPTIVRSRDNPLLLRLRRLARDPTAYRRLKEVWIEGEHLCAAARARGVRPAQAVVSDSAWQLPPLRELALWAPRVVQVPDALFGLFSGLQTGAGLGYLMVLADATALRPGTASVVLDRLQDAGNVGSILRSAAAFGVTQVLALSGTAALWSPKVLRAGMGAHFGLRLVEGLHRDDLDALSLPWIGTSLGASLELHRTVLPAPCAWLFGNEGQGIAAELLERCDRVLRIPQPGGEESLNVAAAAAVCLYESLRQRIGAPAPDQ